MDIEAFEDIKERLRAFGASKSAVIGIAVILLLAVIVGAGRLMGTATASEFQLEKAGGNAAAEEQAPDAGDVKGVFVHVTGAVANPGLYEVEKGARLAEAVQAAGGFAEDAAPESVNLAREVSDGEQVFVGHRQDAGQVEGGGDEGRAPSGPEAQSDLVNINTANAVELVMLPGIGEATAAKIVSDRQANGPFKTLDDLKRVAGIGDKKFEALQGLICV